MHPIKKLPSGEFLKKVASRFGRGNPNFLCSSSKLVISSYVGLLLKPYLLNLLMFSSFYIRLSIASNYLEIIL